MNGRALLDTSAVIALLAGDSAAKDCLAQAKEVSIACIALGELYYGARKSAREEANIARIDELSGSTAIVEIDAETARQYGRIKRDLERKGRPLPENDIWIAALAAQHGLTVFTRDQHFGEIDGLPVEIF